MFNETDSDVCCISQNQIRTIIQSLNKMSKEHSGRIYLLANKQISTKFVITKCYVVFRSHVQPNYQNFNEGGCCEINVSRTTVNRMTMLIRATHQNHRMVWVGRDLRDNPVLTPPAVSRNATH